MHVTDSLTTRIDVIITKKNVIVQYDNGDSFLNET